MNANDWPLYRYRGEVTYIVDGDTIEVMLDLGDRTYRRRRIRLLGYNAPELFRGSNRSAGARARDKLADLLPLGSTVYLHTQLDTTTFDRLLAHAYADAGGSDLLDVAEAMVSGGWGKRA